MTDTITLTGIVATVPNHLVTGEGLPITSFRLASTHRRFDRSSNSWVDGDTNWYTVTAFRQLAMNIHSSIGKGERLVVTGRLRIRDWTAGAKNGTNIEVDADAIGHDLSWGTASFTRSISSAVVDAATRVENDPAESATSSADTPDDSSSGSLTGDWPTVTPGTSRSDEDEKSSAESLSSMGVPF